MAWHSLFARNMFIAAPDPERRYRHAPSFTVIDAPDTVNAFALPGGKVAVYTGLLPVAQDSAGLAAVLGHEIAHAIARHGVPAQRVDAGADQLRYAGNLQFT